MTTWPRYSSDACHRVCQHLTGRAIPWSLRPPRRPQQDPGSLAVPFFRREEDGIRGCKKTASQKYSGGTPNDSVELWGKTEMVQA